MRPATDSTIIRFSFDAAKSLEAMCYLVSKLGEIDKVALAKLLYIADRDHFLNYGNPITGDKLFALPRGPVCSNSLNLLAGEFDIFGTDAYEYIEQAGHQLSIHTMPPMDHLKEDDRSTLDAVLQQYGQMAKKTWDLVEATHKFPEYAEVFTEGTSTLIPYELILKHYGDESRFHHDRPVITRDIARQMSRPFWGNDEDL